MNYLLAYHKINRILEKKTLPILTPSNTRFVFNLEETELQLNRNGFYYDPKIVGGDEKKSMKIYILE